MVTIGFLHTAEAHVATFDRLVDVVAREQAEQAPEWTVRHRVDERLLADARVGGLTAELADRVRGRLRELKAEGAELIVCTCSTIGAVAEESADALGVPVLRADRPMADAAVAVGGRIGVLVTTASTREPTLDLLRDSAARAGVPVSLTSELVATAWGYFEAGELDRYYAEIAVQAGKLAPEVDVIVLAQASMAPAADLIQGVPVLASPRSAVEAAFARRSAAEPD